jgi:hypothetical protein
MLSKRGLGFRVRVPSSAFDILRIVHITAVFISRHLGPVIPTSAILKKGVHIRLHIYPSVGSFACPGIDNQVQGISVIRLIQRTRQSK